MAVSRVSGVLSSLVSRPLWLSRTITTTYKLFSDEKSLEEAKQRVMQLKEDPGNEKKLYLYAFYKQVHVGMLISRDYNKMSSTICQYQSWDWEVLIRLALVSI